MIFKGLGDHYKHIYSGSLPLIGLIYTSNSHRVTEIFIFTGWVMIRSPVPPSAIAATIQGTTALSKMLAAAGTCFVGMTHIGDNTSWIQNTFYIYIYLHTKFKYAFPVPAPMKQGVGGRTFVGCSPEQTHGQSWHKKRVEMRVAWFCSVESFSIIQHYLSSNKIVYGKLMRVKVNCRKNMKKPSCLNNTWMSLVPIWAKTILRRVLGPKTILPKKGSPTYAQKVVVKDHCDYGFGCLGLVKHTTYSKMQNKQHLGNDWVAIVA